MNDKNAAKEIERVVAAYQGGALKEGVVPIRKAHVVDDEGAMHAELVAHFATKGFAVSFLDDTELRSAEEELERVTREENVDAAEDVDAAELKVVELRRKHHPDLVRLSLKKFAVDPKKEG